MEPISDQAGVDRATPLMSQEYAPLQRMKDRLWQTFVENNEARLQLESESFVKIPLDILHTSLNVSLSRFIRKGASAEFMAFKSSLHHFEIFASALRQATGSGECENVICGAVRAVLQTAEISSKPVDRVLISLADLNTSFLSLGDIVFSGSQERSLDVLQEIFNAYSEYCIEAIRFLRPTALIERIMSPFKYFINTNSENRFIEIQKRIEMLILQLGTLGNPASDQYARSRSIGHESTIQEHPSFGSGGTANLPILARQSSLSSSFSSLVQYPVVVGRPMENFSFTGRQGILERIHQALMPGHDQKGPSCCILHGIGGIGKTQTALKYTFLNESCFDVIAWVKAEVDFDILRCFSDIARKLKLVPILTPLSSSTEGTPDDGSARGKLDGIEEAREWFRTANQRWLLVFDNVDERDNITKFIPETDKSCGSIIITTQRLQFPQVTRAFQRIQLESLGTEDGSQLLLDKIDAGRSPVDKSDRHIAEEITHIVGGLPLSIATIGGFITASGQSLREFLVTLKESNIVWAKTETEQVDDYERSLATVFNIALAELPPNARQLLNILAYMNADFIPEEMLIGEHNDDELRFLNNKHKFSSMLIDLKTRQLVKRDPPKAHEMAFVSLHRSLQLSLLNTLSSNTVERTKVFHWAFYLIRSQLPPPSEIQVSDSRGWNRYKTYVPQVISLREHSRWPEPPLQLDYDFAQVLADIGNYLRTAGLMVEAESMLRAAEEILVGLGKNHDHLMSDIDLLIGVVDDMTGISRRTDSLYRHKRALEIRKTYHSKIQKDRLRVEDHIRLWNAHADLGCTYLGDERCGEAEKIFEDCLAEYKKWGSEDDFPYEYGKYYYYMGFVRTMQGRHTEAIDLGTEACRLQERHAGGPDALLVQNYKFALAIRYYHAGQYDRALELNERVLAARRHFFGNFNKYTRDSLSVTGAMLHKLGHIRKAKDYLDEALKNATSWTEEGQALAHKRLSRILYDLRENDKAEHHQHKAEAIRDRFWADFSEYMINDPDNEMAVYNRMTSHWSGRLIDC